MPRTRGVRFLLDTAHTAAISRRETPCVFGSPVRWPSSSTGAAAARASARPSAHRSRSTTPRSSRTSRTDDGGDVAVHADLSGIATFHANDMVVDGHGRAYVGNFGWDYESGAPVQKTALALVHPDGRVVRAAEDLAFPNGMVLTPDGRTLIVAETFAQCLTAFDVAGDGGLSNRRLWASVDPVFPDGICLDAAGAVWVASPLSNEVVRVREGGDVADRIATGRHTIACTLGGPDRRTLFVLTSEAIRR